MNKNSKIYVAGHLGLVGSAILKNLKSKGYTNIVYKSHAELELTNQQAVAEFFEEQKPEYVILAAAKVGGIVANNTYRADFIYDNLQVQNNVIHQSYIHGVKKLLFLGSTCIYPKNSPQPMKEEYLLTSELEYTNEPYAIAKIAGIKMCESYNIQYGTNFISVMPTNLYGANDNFDLEKSHVLPALIRKIHLGKCLEENNWEAIRVDLNKNPIKSVKRLALSAKDEEKIILGNSTKEEILEALDNYGIKLLNTKSSTLNTSIEIWGSGLPRREFMHSEDMADACVYLMEKINFKDVVDSYISNSCTSGCEPITNNQYTNIPITNTHINIGTGKDISIKELAELIKNIIGFRGEFYFNMSKPDGTMIKRTNPSKLHSLGWEYKVELENGIKMLYQYYKKGS